MNFISGLISKVQGLFQPKPALAGVKSPLPSSQNPGGYNSEVSNPALSYYYTNQFQHEQNAANRGFVPHVPPVQPTATPTPVQNYAPRVMGAQAPQITSYQQQPTAGYQQNITIPYSQGGQFRLNPQLAQALMNAFDKTNQATNAATVLNHPLSQTYTPQNIAATGRKSFNYGENASFKQSNVDRPNLDGSIDRGLFRINNNTFNGMKADPYWSKAMAKYGIKNWDDMEDPQKNAYMANLLQQRQGWNAWFAAPLKIKNY